MILGVIEMNGGDIRAQTVANEVLSSLLSKIACQDFMSLWIFAAIVVQPASKLAVMRCFTFDG